MQLIQAVIARLADNSFKVKGWLIAVFTGVLALAINQKQSELVYAALFPLLVFWLLDSYFLWQERNYRSLFNKVRKTEEKAIDFNMILTQEIFETNTIWGVVFSPMILIFYFGLGFVVFLIPLFLKS
jgi:predicted membrane-bound mannosyltransferase